jgi:hypothetical protein
MSWQRQNLEEKAIKGKKIRIDKAITSADVLIQSYPRS